MRSVALTLCAVLSGCANPNRDDEVLAQLRVQQATLERIGLELRTELQMLRERTAAAGADSEETEALRAQVAALQSELEEAKARPAAPARRDGPDPAAVYSVPIDGSPFTGPSDAWVTIVEFSDFQCPFCSRVVPTLRQLLANYPKDVRLVFKHLPLPFHPRARPSAFAVECAFAQQKFWPMHDLLFDSQRALEDEDLARYAVNAGGLDIKRWERCVTEKQPEERVARDEALAARIGARGTPSFFINGRMFSGAQPYETFKALIDEELGKAKASRKNRATYYDTEIVGRGLKEL